MSKRRRPYKKPRLVELGGVSRLTHARANAMGKFDNVTDKSLREMS